MSILYDNQVDMDRLRGRTVAVLGFGAQGRAQALNLRDSAVGVVVGLRADSPSVAAAASASLEVDTPADAVARADIVLMLVPDQVQADLYAEAVAPNLRRHGTLVFAHGYNIRYQHIEPRADLDVVLVAPLGIGEQVRAQYEAGGGTPGLVAVHQDASGQARADALALASALGHGRAGIIETTFAEETETDLFAEQAVLCGGINQLVTAAFETLVDAGYSPEIAYFCCQHEVKLIADIVHQRGIAGMRESISTTAEFGDYTRGPRVIGEDSRARMRDLLAEIRDGRFDRELGAEIAAGLPTITAGREQARAHLLEKVGRQLRERLQADPDHGPASADEQT